MQNVKETADDWGCLKMPLKTKNKRNSKNYRKPDTSLAEVNFLILIKQLVGAKTSHLVKTMSVITKKGKKFEKHLQNVFGAPKLMVIDCAKIKNFAN